MQVALILEGLAGRCRDLVVDVEPERTVGELAEALACFVGDPSGSWTLVVAPDVLPVEPTLLVGAIGLVQGSRVSLASASHQGDQAALAPSAPTTFAPRIATLELGIVGGTSSGEDRTRTSSLPMMTASRGVMRS
jgi:hypothetical protein